MKLAKIIGSIIVLTLLSACSGNLKNTAVLAVNSILQESAQVKEFPIKNISLAGDIAKRNSEISGLAWYQDYLIILPQYPNFARHGSFLYAIAKKDIKAYLANDDSPALEPIKIPFEAGKLAKTIDGYEGYESIAFRGDNVYLTIEANTHRGMRSYLLKGSIATDLSKIVLDSHKIIEIVPPVNLRNQSDEAILVVDDKIISIFEANGENVNPEPKADIFDVDLGKIDSISFPRIEYRVTDSTEIDENNRFWVINYFYPGDRDLYSDNDLIAETFGQGASHAQNEQVERLVELEYSENKIKITNTPPIQLQLDGEIARNWEGIVRLDDMGFLIATDKYPKTIFGFVATNSKPD